METAEAIQESSKRIDAIHVPVNNTQGLLEQFQAGKDKPNKPVCRVEFSADCKVTWPVPVQGESPMQKKLSILLKGGIIRALGKHI
ncbi:MAG: hypothetical protein ABII81_02730 [Pseudomonadota bacterium]